MAGVKEVRNRIDVDEDAREQAEPAPSGPPLHAPAPPLPPGFGDDSPSVPPGFEPCFPFCD